MVPSQEAGCLATVEERQPLLNLWRRTVNLTNPDSARTEASTGPKIPRKIASLSVQQEQHPISDIPSAHKLPDPYGRKMRRDL